MFRSQSSRKRSVKKLKKETTVFVTWSLLSTMCRLIIPRLSKISPITRFFWSWHKKNFKKQKKSVFIAPGFKLHVCFPSWWSTDLKTGDSCCRKYRCLRWQSKKVQWTMSTKRSKQDIEWKIRNIVISVPGENLTNQEWKRRNRQIRSKQARKAR